MTLGTKDFMGISHAQCAMQAADMSYRLEQAEKLIDELVESLEQMYGPFSKVDAAHDKALASAKAWKEGT